MLGKEKRKSLHAHGLVKHGQRNGIWEKILENKLVGYRIGN